MSELPPATFQAADLCNKCGFCQAGCPVYKVTGVEWMTARGRVALIKDVLDGKLPLDDELREPLFSCLTCNGCVDHCPPGVPTADLVLRARAALVERRGQPWPERLAFRHILPGRSRLALAARALRAGQRAGALPLASRLPGAGLLAVAARVLPFVPSRAASALVPDLVRPLERPRYRVAYFVGCAAEHLFPEVATATVRVLHRHECEVVLPAFVCCGKPPLSYGDAAAATALARRNVALAETLAVDAVVTPCATCSSFLKDYGKLLQDDERCAAQAKDFAAKVRDVGEFLTGIGLNRDMGALPSRKVTWHDPCHLGRFQKLGAPPRQILRSIPGLDFVELPEANVCCGGAGTYSLTHPDISTQVLARKMENVAATGADLLATSCPACGVQLRYGVRRHSLSVQTVELVQLLDEAYRAAPLRSQGSLQG